MRINKEDHHVLLFIAFILWIGALGAGFAILEREEFTPVPNGQVQVDFPTNSSIRLTSDKQTLLVFLHPLCPCSRATLHQLDEILAEVQGKISVVAVFTIPKGLEPGWEKDDLWQTATAMPGVRVVRDSNGVEAGRFGVKGSGHALMYSPSGRLLFSGGITASRGHEGDNPGESAVVGFALRGHADVSRTPVFGCSLLR